MASRRRQGQRVACSVVAAAIAAGAVSGCSAGSTSAAPRHSTPASTSPTPTSSASADTAFVADVRAHGQRGTTKALVILGRNFVCASFANHETRAEMVQAGVSHGLHRRVIDILTPASVKYLCPQYKALAGG